MQTVSVTNARNAESAQLKPSLFHGLVLLDAFVLGGVLALILVQDLLVTIMYRLVSAEAQGEILNVLDHMLPYQLAFWSVALVLTLLTTIALRVRTNSWWIAALPVIAFVALCVVGFLI